MALKKIWYLSKYALNPNKGGPQRQYLFAKYFSKKGYQTCLISSNSNGFYHMDFKGNYKLEEYNNFKHFTLKGYKVNLGFNVRRIISWFLFEIRLLKFLKKQKIQSGDIVIVSSLSILTFLSGRMLKEKYNIKLIVEVRDIWPQTLVDFKKYSKSNPLIMFLSWVEKIGYNYADVIVGTMGNLKAHVKSITPGCEKKVIYVPMGFDKDVYGQYREYKKNDDDIFVVGYAGTIGQANKIDLIMEAAQILVNNKQIKFKLLGDGRLKDKYLTKYSHLNNVNFFPKADKVKMFEFLNTCNILLNPWEDNEIYDYGVSPNKWIDYMFSAKPIIVPFNGYKNIINEAQCGEFIETNNPKLLADTILKYYKMSEEERERIGLNGREYLERNLTYEILSDKYLKFIT